MDKSDENVGTGLVGAPACGDVMRLQLKISDAGVIEDSLDDRAVAFEWDRLVSGVVIVVVVVETERQAFEDRGG